MLKTFFCCFATRPGKPLVVGKSPRRGPFDARPRPLLLFNRIRDHEDLKDPRETASISTAFGASVRRRPRWSAASRPHCQSQELFFALFRTFFDTINAFLFPPPPSLRSRAKIREKKTDVVFAGFRRHQPHSLAGKPQKVVEIV